MKNYKSLVIPILIYSLGICLFTFWSYWKKRGDILDGIDKRLVQAAQTVKYILANDFHDRNAGKCAISQVEDMNNIMALTQHAKSVDVTYLRTAIFLNGKLFFTSSNTTDQDIASNTITYYGEEVDSQMSRLVQDCHALSDPFFFNFVVNNLDSRIALIEEISPTGNKYSSMAIISLENINRMLLRQIPVSILQGLFFLVLTIPLVVVFERTHARHRDELEKARIEAEKAQLEMLRYQLNPHFLFNTLNSINILVHSQPELAKRMVLQLADFCRASLFRRGEQVSTLEQEVELVRKYLEIEKTRWGDQLQPDVGIDPGLGATALPPFLFQPLVENAIKYGQLSEADPLKVNVSAKKENSDIIIEVSNTGKWFEPGDPEVPTSTRVGLENLKKRLKSHYGERFKLTSLVKEGWVTMQICIPTTMGAGG